MPPFLRVVFPLQTLLSEVVGAGTFQSRLIAAPTASCWVERGQLIQTRPLRFFSQLFKVEQETVY